MRWEAKEQKGCLLPGGHIAGQEGRHMCQRGGWPLLLLRLAVGGHWGGAHPVGGVVVHLKK